jgi:hypothetical protein
MIATTAIETDNIRLRCATERDVKKMLLAQSQMMFPETAKDMRRGGLITKPNRQELLFCIRNGQVLLLEDLRLNKIVGFAIGFADEVMRQNSYLRKFVIEDIKWNEIDDSKQILESRLSFIYMLGIVPDPAYKLYALPLVLAIGKSLFDRHEYVLTTIIDKPMVNFASRQMVELFRGRKVGDMELENPMLGAINLALYGMERSIFQALLEDRYMRRALKTITNLERSVFEARPEESYLRRTLKAITNVCPFFQSP